MFIQLHIYGVASHSVNNDDITEKSIGEERMQSNAYLWNWTLRRNTDGGPQQAEETWLVTGMIGSAEVSDYLCIGNIVRTRNHTLRGVQGRLLRYRCRV